MAIYNNDKDPNDIQWEQEQMEIQILEPRRKFEQWLEQNKERILAKDKLNNMKTFNDLEFKEHPNKMGGIITRIMFENGYGASIAQTPFSYGGDEGLYELAVLGKDGFICYDASISTFTSDVIGYLSEDEVTKLMEQIQNLEIAP
jgi:hypothetical protein